MNTTLNTTRYQIRPGRLDELEHLREIEQLAGRAFADHGMPEVAEDEPPDIDTLSNYCLGGRLWVAVDSSDLPVGYLIAELVDGCAHIEQVSVHPHHAGQRIGEALIETLTRWAAARGLPALTLRTFKDVPWNAPYYERIGFLPVPEADESPGLRTIRNNERRLGLDRWPRQCMRRHITDAGS